MEEASQQNVMQLVNHIMIHSSHYYAWTSKDLFSPCWKLATLGVATFFTLSSDHWHFPWEPIFSVNVFLCCYYSAPGSFLSSYATSPTNLFNKVGFAGMVPWVQINPCWSTSRKNKYFKQRDCRRKDWLEFNATSHFQFLKKMLKFLETIWWNNIRQYWNNWEYLTWMKVPESNLK